LFDIWIRAGDEITSKGRIVTKRYPVVQRDQPTAKITVYSTEMENPFYIDDDPEASIDLSFNVDFKDLSSGKNRCVDLEITFGFTEVQIIAKADGEPVIVKFNLEDEFNQKKIQRTNNLIDI